MTIAEYEAYISTINDVENRIIDDTKFPVVKDSKIKTCCYTTLELSKLVINYIKYNIHGNKEKQTQFKSKDD